MANYAMPDNRPHLIEKIDLNAPIDVLRRTLVAGTDALLRLRITRGPSPENTTGASIELHLSGDDDGTPWAQTCAGEAEDAASGWWKIEIPAAKLNLVGDIDGQILLTDADTQESCSQLLRLKVIEKLTGGATPPPGSEINWAEYTGYANTASKGPVRPHSGTLEVKATNADGSISIGVKDGLYDPAGSAATVAGNLTAHIDDTTAAHAATAISNTPAGGIAATTVQAAINELDTEKANDNNVVKLSGTDQTVQGVLRTSGGASIGTNIGTTTGSINAASIVQLRPVSGTGGIVESLIGGENLILRGRTSAAPTGNIILGGLGEYSAVEILRALNASLPFHDSAGAEHALLTSTGLRIRPRIVSSSITAELDGVYHGTAAATYTDPTPAEGRGYLVRVVNGTQTVGGTAYAAEGTVIMREYHSGAWRNRVLFGGADAAGVRTNIGAAALTPTVNPQTGTTYTLAAADAGAIVTMTNGSANLLTIPTNAAVPLPVGTIANVLQGGAGVTSVKGDTGVTFNGVSGGTGAITARWQGVALLKVATDTWIGSGSIGTVA